MTRKTLTRDEADALAAKLEAAVTAAQAAAEAAQAGAASAEATAAAVKATCSRAAEEAAMVAASKVYMAARRARQQAEAAGLDATDRLASEEQSRLELRACEHRLRPQDVRLPGIECRALGHCDGTHAA